MIIIFIITICINDTYTYASVWTTKHFVYVDIYIYTHALYVYKLTYVNVFTYVNVHMHTCPHVYLYV